MNQLAYELMYEWMSFQHNIIAYTCMSLNYMNACYERHNACEWLGCNEMKQIHEYAIMITHTQLNVHTHKCTYVHNTYMIECMTDQISMNSCIQTEFVNHDISCSIVIHCCIQQMSLID